MRLSRDYNLPSAFVYRPNSATNVLICRACGLLVPASHATIHGDAIPILRAK